MNFKEVIGYKSEGELLIELGDREKLFNLLKIEYTLKDIKEAMKEELLKYLDLDEVEKAWNLYKIDAACENFTKKCRLGVTADIYEAVIYVAVDIANQYIRDIKKYSATALQDFLEIIEELDRLYTIQKKTDIKQILKLRWEKLQRYSCKKLQLPPFKKFKPKARTVI